MLAAKPHTNSFYVAFFPLGMRDIRQEGFNSYNEFSMGENSLADRTGFLGLAEYENEAIYTFLNYLVREIKWLFFEVKDVGYTRLSQFLDCCS